MIVKQVTYKVHPEKLDAVLEAIERFVRAVAEHEPSTVYAAYRDNEEPTAFVHLMRFPDAQAEEAHRQAPYTDQFVEVLYPSCEEEPVFRDLRLLGEA